MKPKTLNKRLELNKKTIANLSEKAMGNAHGGVNETAFTHCTPSCISECPKSCGPLSVCICEIVDLIPLTDPVC